MKVYILKYKPKESSYKAVFNYALFGRIIHKIYRGKTYYYYSRGLLHDIKFAKLAPAKLFVEKNIMEKNVELEAIYSIGNIEIKGTDYNEENLTLLTGLEHRQEFAKRKGILLRFGKRTHGKRN